MRIVRYHHPRALAPRATFVSPWAGWEDEIDRVMNSAFAGFLSEPALESALHHPRVDLYEDKDNYHFRAELPGLKRDDIRVELSEGVLNIAGTRREFNQDGSPGRTGEFSRSVSVPARVQQDKIAARYEDGVLTVTLPKAEEVKPRRIAVQVK